MLDAKAYESIVIEHAKRASQAANDQMKWWSTQGHTLERIKDAGAGYTQGYKDALRDLRLHKVV